MVYYKCLEHFDKFGDAEVIYWVDVSGVPERLVDEAKRIDGADYSDGCFGVCIQHDRETGGFAAIEDNPGQNIYYVDNLGEKHWFDYSLSEQELEQIASKIRISMKDDGREN